MKSGASQKLGRYLLSFICVVAYLFLFTAMIANTLNVDLHDFLLG
jgi:hypothetical protein